MSTADWLDRSDRTVAAVYPWCSDVVAERGEGCWIIDVDGRRWLDFTSGIGVSNTGHCHPAVVAAIKDQADRLLHTSVTTRHTRIMELAERIGRLMPFFDEPQSFFCGSGAEAVDGALKLARKVTGRPGIIAFRGAFHGRTLAATSITTAKGKYREGYEPLLPSVTIAPYAYPLRYGGSPQRATIEALAALDELLTLQAPGHTVASMIVEPVLGEGGYVVPPVDWLRGLRERCDRYGILLIFDEVQCGMGRTGKAFAAETFGVTPDVVLFAKGIASGMPMGGIVAPRALMERWPQGAHGTTFGGNPVVCAAAIATIDVMEREGLFAQAKVLGDRALDVLRHEALRNKAVAEVRGVGLMLAIEFTSKEACAAAQEAATMLGMLVLTCGPGENVLRLIPPLTISDDELDLGLAILTKAMQAAAKAPELATI